MVSVPKVDKKCEACLFVHAEKINPETLKKQLTCRLKPPAVQAIGGPLGVSVLTAFPNVENNQYCHEFKSRVRLSIHDAAY